jgi:hypothetical protein
VRPTFTPTASKASALAWAVPDEPVTIAPAWPIRFPGGAVFGGSLFGVSADLADQNDNVGFVVLLEHTKGFDVIKALDRIAADAETRRLAESSLRKLVNDLICQGSAARNQADPSGRTDFPGNDSEVGLLRRDQARAIRTHQNRRRSAKV